MAKAATKRIMREFKLDEISAVTAPAQKGARMVIMKRDGEPQGPTSDADLAAIVKRGKYLMTTPTNGHAHLVEVDDWAKLSGGGYTTSICVPGYGGGRDHYHSHPFVIGPKGEITIGEADGHVHQLADVPTMKAADDQPAPVTTSTLQKDDEAMTPEELAKLQGDIAKASSLAAMTDAQKTHYAKLSGDEAEAFLKADFKGREEAIAKAAAAASEADPVVFTTKSGIPFRRSAGEAVIALAKQNDELRDTLSGVTKASQDSEAETLAKSWVHMGKTAEEKLELARHIVALPPVAKAAALEGIKAGAVAMAPLFKSFGAADGSTSTADSPLAKLEKLTAERMAKTSEGHAIAYSKVLETPEGGALYNEVRAASATH